MKKFDTLEQEVLESKQANELQNIILSHADMVLESITDVYELHLEISWCLNIMAHDGPDDGDKYKKMLAFSVCLTQVERDYHLLLASKLEAMENGSVVLPTKNKAYEANY